MLLQATGRLLRVFLENTYEVCAKARDADWDQALPKPEGQLTSARMPPPAVDVHEPEKIRHDALGRREGCVHLLLTDNRTFGGLSFFLSQYWKSSVH